MTLPALGGAAAALELGVAPPRGSGTFKPRACPHPAAGLPRLSTGPARQQAGRGRARPAATRACSGAVAA